MKNRLVVPAALCLLLPIAAHAVPAQPARPFALECDNLATPLGDDNAAPRLSWKLADSRSGAVQTAYRIVVATKPALLASTHADVWNSGKISSSESVNVAYAGPALKPETRYYWRVEVWDQHGKAYPASEVSWWETGLMKQDWTGQWIGYEDREQHAIREAHADWVTNPNIEDSKKQQPPIKGPVRHELRFGFDLTARVKKATLYATGEDTPSAWVNGTQVITPWAPAPWGRLPWRTYRHVDVTDRLSAGHNLLAVEVTHFGDGGAITPMNAILYVEGTDGSVHTYATGKSDWKSSLQAPDGWQQPNFDDQSWKPAVVYPMVHDAFGATERLGLPLPTQAVASLRHGFVLDKPIAEARLYATALGAYQFDINGQRVSDDFLAPGWTDFRQRAYYQTYDVTRLLTHGSNAIGALLAPGWYSTPLEWVGQGNNYGWTQAALRAQLRITYRDGSTQWISTGPDWKADTSSIKFAEIYDGETEDARDAQPGWDKPAFKDADWHEAMLVEPENDPKLEWQSFQPIRAERSMEPIAVTHPKPGVTIYDFGQNMAAVPRITVAGKNGETMQLRFAELLNPDGTLYVANLRNAKATDRYTFASSATVTFEPRFTFHGFRYMEITGVPAPSAPHAVQAIVLHTDAPFDVTFSTGNAMLNQLWHNIQWGQRSNFVGTPTDCPQRDERLGWSADAQVFWRTASYDMDLAAFSRKYSGDLDGSLGKAGMFGIYAPGTTKVNTGYGPGWSDAGVIVPWTSWLQNRDTEILKQAWPAMTRYMDTIAASNPDFLFHKNMGIEFGDWLSPEGSTTEPLLATAYWAYDAQLMAEMAHALGNDADEQKYRDLFEKVRSAFQKAYVHEDGVVGWKPDQPPAAGKPALVQTQTGYALALYMNLMPEEMRAQAAQHLVDRIAANHWLIGTGFLGTPYLLEVLSQTGHSDVAYRMLLNTEYPSWGYMVEHGATTMWERWNGDKMLGDPGMNSFNHYAYGAVAEWLYRYAAGVDATPLDAGYHTIVLHPQFDTRIGHLDFEYKSAYGAIRSSWVAKDSGTNWTVTIPPNTSAKLEMGGAAKDSLLKQGAQADNASCDAAGACQLILPAGTYHVNLPAK
ncbi:family 78 glycoside hydrolase catalytic domain [Silvibacterium sp.]|uniref:family 78 glycoside hydrolase catalytic domain n=1 Tax=Silvibacterium sp. TaxID=1964179 RepID=UPI0039E55DAC